MLKAGAFVYLTLFGLSNIFLLTRGLNIAWNEIDGISSNVSSLLQNDIEEARQFTITSISTVENYVNYKLPPAAIPEGEIILRNFKENIAQCENFLDTVANVWKYKQCASGLMRDTMIALGGLQQKYRPFSSSATRLTLFW